MNSPTLVLLDTATLHQRDLDFSPLQKFGKVISYPSTSPSETIQRLSEATIVLTNKVPLGKDVFREAKSLRLVAICATGTNNVDLVAARDRGVQVRNVTGYSTRAVAQHTMAFILNWATQMHRFIPEANAWAQSPLFVRLDYPIIELSGRQLGLVGTGRIGKEVGRLAETFGMKIKSWDRLGTISSPHTPWPRLPLKDLFQTSDIVSLHCPLTNVTRHIINRESLQWMRSNTFLVNTGRGDLVDESALVEALASGKLGGAGLDVLSAEPPPRHHPLLGLKHPNLMITPHTAWTPLEARKRLLSEVIANIEAFLRGEDRNRIV